MELIVQKYGGTSVGTVDRIKAVAAHIAETVRSGKQVVVVVSAMGEQTDELIGLAKQICAEPPHRELDMLLTAGERISMALLSIALHELQVPSVSLTGSQSGILTDETHGNARIQKILGDRIRVGLQGNNVVIVAGFQGVSPKTREITTLGRGGSDLSAIALAAALQAKSCELYKDVDGVYTADPRMVPAARPIATLSWESMCNLAWAGASVLHSRGAHVAAKFAIPLEIRSSFNLNVRGTLVKGKTPMESVLVNAIAHKTDMALVRLTTSQQTSSLMAKSLDWLWSRGETPLVNMQRHSTDGVELVQVFTEKNTQKYLELFGREGVQAHVQQHLACVTIVGSGFWQSPETIERISEALSDLQFLDVTNSTITLCLPSASLKASLATLHALLLKDI